VSIDTNRSGEFRHYRRVLTAIYLGTVTAGFLLLAASIAKELLFRRPATDAPRATADRAEPSPEEILRCHAQVLSLLTRLGEKTCELMAVPPVKGDRGELASSWEDFSRSWHHEWDVIDARCQFSELKDAKLGVAHDRLAQVHGDLPTMRLRYQSLLVRFDDEQAAELARMRRALDLAEEALEQRARGER
jgi:hypothetical protein